VRLGARWCQQRRILGQSDIRSCRSPGVDYFCFGTVQTTRSFFLRDSVTPCGKNGRQTSKTSMNTGRRKRLTRPGARLAMRPVVLLEIAHALRQRSDLADGRYHCGNLPPEAQRRGSCRSIPARYALPRHGTEVERTVSSSCHRMVTIVPVHSRNQARHAGRQV